MFFHKKLFFSVTSRLLDLQHFKISKKIFYPTIKATSRIYKVL